MKSKMLAMLDRPRFYALAAARLALAEHDVTRLSVAEDGCPLERTAIAACAACVNTVPGRRLYRLT